VTPVSEPSQVLNLLRGLNKNYRHVKPVLTSKTHTFMSARSYLLLEELQLRQEDKADAGQAFVAGHSGTTGSGASASSGGSSGSGGSTGSSAPNSDGNRGSRSKNKRRGRGNYGSPSSSGGGGPSGGGQPTRPPAPWSGHANPWTGLVQAWGMPFRAPGSGVLGPRPPFQAQQAMLAHHSPPSTPGGASSTYGTQSWDNSALYAALQNAGVATQPPSSTDWYFDTGASTHMSSTSGITSSPTPLPFQSFITIGNGARLPVTHTAAATIPTSSSPLQLNNVLITPSLIKNLISVKQLTRDNNVSVEFDPVGFSVKDLATQTVILRCKGVGDLYPVRLPQHQAHTASSSDSVELAHLAHDADFAATLRALRSASPA
jgi:hypothetical protein